MTMKKVLIGLDKLSNPNSGFGRVSIDYANALEDTSDFEFTYLIPSDYEGSIAKGKRTIRLNWWRRNFPFYQKEFDLIHAVHHRPEFRIRKDKKLLLTIHDLSFAYVHTKREMRKLKRKLCRLLRQSTALAFISDFTRQDCIEKLHVPEHLMTKRIYDGVSLLKKVETAPDNLPDKKILFSIGVFSRRKNFAALLPFIELLPDDYILVLAGNNNTGYGSFVEFTIGEMGLKNRVILTGEINEEEKSFLYHHCDAFLFPSLVEGFGLPLIEAMQTGKPVFASKKSSLAELGKDYVYYWEDMSPEAMKEVFEKGMADFSPEKAKAEQEYALSFTWQENVKQYLAYYKEILS